MAERPTVGRIERLSDGRLTGPPIEVPNRSPRSAVIAKVANGYLLALSEMNDAEAHRLAYVWGATFPDAPMLAIRGSLVDLTNDEVPPAVRAWLDETMEKLP